MIDCSSTTSEELDCDSSDYMINWFTQFYFVILIGARWNGRGSDEQEPFIKNQEMQNSWTLASLARQKGTTTDPFTSEL